MSATARAWAALATLGLILAITASWWALALWPVPSDGPQWVLLTREVCFGSTPDGLPNAGGWVLLVGQPLGMIGLLAAVWGAELRAGLALAMGRASGQLAVGIATALMVTGAWSVAARVRDAGREPFSTGAERDIATQLTRLRDVPPAMALTDQSGRDVTLEDFRGRPVVVAFAYAHCQTICPVIVSDLLAAQQRLEEARPVVVVVTLDPWRDTPSRLPSIAKQWGLGSDAHVLSGPPETVERTLNAWRVPRTRNQRTGDLTHPPIVYVIGADGRIAYAVGGNADAITAAVRGL
jgi:cytochrome oxidase Cu insertion factor (SCO1/SenC/PrrC family)